MRRDEKFGVPFLLILMALVIGAVLTSGGRYFEVRKFNLLDARQGERVVLEYDRVIKRDFDADWRVDLYRNGVWVAEATSPRTHRYRTIAVLPDPKKLDLAWLTYGDPAFDDLACGDYRVVVSWIINPQSLLMRRRVEAQDSFVVICDDV